MKSIFVSFVTILSPVSLYACPMCNAGSSDQTLKIIGTFLTLPFLVFAVATIAYLKISRKETRNR